MWSPRTATASAQGASDLAVHTRPPERMRSAGASAAAAGVTMDRRAAHTVGEQERIKGYLLRSRRARPDAGADLRDLFPRIHLVADELKPGGQLRKVETAGGSAREVEAKLLQL